MKILLLSLLLLNSLGALASNEKCSQYGFYIHNDNEEHSNCQNSVILTKEDLPNFPTKGTRQLTFVISIAQSSECDGAARLPIFGITIKPDGETGAERQIVEFGSPQGTGLINAMNVHTTDTSGTPKLVSAEPFDLDDWNRIVVSIDLEKNLFSIKFLSELGITSNTLTTVDYGDWSFDDTIAVYLGQSNSAGSPAAKMIWRSFTFDYAYYPKTELYRFLFQALDISQRGLYSSQEENKFFINDTSGVDADKSFGALYTDQLASGISNLTTTPFLSQLGVNFTEPTQHLTFRSPIPDIASEGHFFFLPDSFTINFWIRLNELPSDTSYLLRRFDTKGFNVFALKVNSEGKVIAIISDTEITTTISSLVPRQWTFVTAFFVTTIANGNKQATVIIHFWDKLETPSASQALTVIASEFEENSDDKFKIGGFKGILNDLQFYSPGAPIVNNPSCFVNQTCKLSLGYDYSQCLVANCPKGTYNDGTSCRSCDSSCQTCTGAGPNACDSCEPPHTLSETTCTGFTISEKIAMGMPQASEPKAQIETTDQTKSNGLSGGAKAGIVIGIIGLVAVLAYIFRKTLFVEIMTKLKAQDAPVKNTSHLHEPPTPMSPTEVPLATHIPATLATENIVLETDRELQEEQ